MEMWMMAIILVTLFVLYMVFKVKRLGIRKFLVELIVLAEQIYEKEQTNEKFEYCFERLYQLLPSYIRLFITKSMIEKFVQLTFDEIKIALDYQEKKL